MRLAHVLGTMTAAVIAAAVSTGATRRAPPRDVSTILTAARGAPSVLCALAARAVDAGEGWGASVGWSDDAPAPPLSPSLIGTSVPGAVPGAGGGIEWTANAELGAHQSARVPLSPADGARLLDGLASNDPCVRELAARLIGAARDSTLVGQLAARLSAPAAPARAAAAFALGLAGSTAAIDALTRALADPEADVRANAAWALGRTRGGRALPQLIDGARDADPRVRAAVVGTVGRLAGARGSDTIPSTRATATTALLARTLRTDADGRVRRVAAWALARAGAGRRTEFGTPAAGPGDESREPDRVEAKPNYLDEADAALAVSVARDPDPGVREMAAWALNARSRRGAAARATFVASLRTDASAPVRATVAWALGPARAADIAR